MDEMRRRDVLLGALVGMAGATVACAGMGGNEGVDASLGEDLATPDGVDITTWATGGTAALAASYDVGGVSDDP